MLDRPDPGGSKPTGMGRAALKDVSRVARAPFATSAGDEFERLLRTEAGCLPDAVRTGARKASAPTLPAVLALSRLSSSPPSPASAAAVRREQMAWNRPRIQLAALRPTPRRYLPANDLKSDTQPEPKKPSKHAMFLVHPPESVDVVERKFAEFVV